MLSSIVLRGLHVSLVTLLALGCSAGGDPPAGSSDVAETDTRPAGTPTSAVPGGPDGPFGFGEPITAEALGTWDIDVAPDGAGLPAGRGTARAGEEVYRLNCTPCHGAEGEGGPNDQLVSSGSMSSFSFATTEGLVSTIGNYWPYATTVFDYVRRAMPFDRPGSLTNDEVYAVTAWLLWKNDLIAEDAVIDAGSLPDVVMPAKEHFVPSEDVRLPALP